MVDAALTGAGDNKRDHLLPVFPLRLRDLPNSLRHSW